MKDIKTNIFLFAMLAASPLMVNAQTIEKADTTAKKKIHVAFRDTDADHLLGGVSYVDMEELQKKDYIVRSLDDLYGLVSGWDGSHMWGMDNSDLDTHDEYSMVQRLQRVLSLSPPSVARLTVFRSQPMPIPAGTWQRRSLSILALASI